MMLTLLSVNGGLESGKLWSVAFKGWPIFGLFCQIKNIVLSTRNKWLDWPSIFGSVLEENNIEVWGQIDLIHWNWCQNTHVLNFNIFPQCFHHILDVGASFWWFELIPRQVSCLKIFWTRLNLRCCFYLKLFETG